MTESLRDNLVIKEEQAMKRVMNSGERAEFKAFCLALLVVLVAAIVVVWLVGPFGPVIHAPWLKWVIAIADFVIACFVLYILVVFAKTETEWGGNIIDWLE